MFTKLMGLYFIDPLALTIGTTLKELLDHVQQIEGYFNDLQHHPASTCLDNLLGNLVRVSDQYKELCGG